AAAVRRMLDGPSRPTAAIMGDKRIPAAYHVLSELGLAAGENFSVVGTDDLALAASLHPPATTLRVPRQRAVRMALELLDGLLREEQQTWPATLPVEMVVRESTG